MTSLRILGCLCKQNFCNTLLLDPILSQGTLVSLSTFLIAAAPSSCRLEVQPLDLSPLLEAWFEKTRATLTGALACTLVEATAICKGLLVSSFHGKQWKYTTTNSCCCFVATYSSIRPKHSYAQRASRLQWRIFQQQLNFDSQFETNSLKRNKRGECWQ